MGTGWQGLREEKLGFSSYGLLMGSLRESGMQARARVCGKHQHLEQSREGNSPHSRGSAGISSDWYNGRKAHNTDQTQQQLTGGRWVPAADKGPLSPGLSLVSLFCEQYCLSCLSSYAWQADQTSWGGCLCVVCDIIYKSVTIMVITVTEDRC